MFTVDDVTIRNIDSSDSEDGESPQRKTWDHIPHKMQEKERKISINQDHPDKWNPKKRRYQLISSPDRARLRRMLWILSVGAFFLVTCSASALLLKKKLLSEPKHSASAVWWRFPASTQSPYVLEQPGGLCIYSRRFWSDVEVAPASVVLISSTGGDSCLNFSTCSELANESLENFLIGGDGKVYEGTGWGEDTVVISFVGSYDKGEKELTQAQVEAAQQMLEFAVDVGKLSSEYILLAHSSARTGENILKVINAWPHYKPSS